MIAIAKDGDFWDAMAKGDATAQAHYMEEYLTNVEPQALADQFAKLRRKDVELLIHFLCRDYGDEVEMYDEGVAHCHIVDGDVWRHKTHPIYIIPSYKASVNDAAFADTLRLTKP
jgi:hypothetical protein